MAKISVQPCVSVSASVCELDMFHTESHVHRKEQVRDTFRYINKHHCCTEMQFAVQFRERSVLFVHTQNQTVSFWPVWHFERKTHNPLSGSGCESFGQHSWTQAIISAGGM